MTNTNSPRTWTIIQTRAETGDNTITVSIGPDMFKECATIQRDSARQILVTFFGQRKGSAEICEANVKAFCTALKSTNMTIANRNAVMISGPAAAIYVAEFFGLAVDSLSK